MEFLPVLLTLAGVWVVVVISPGPCFLATVQQSTRGTSRDGVWVALGIATGTILWCSGSLLGLAVLLSAVRWLYHTVRLAGAGFLLYLGVRTIIRAHRPVQPAALPPIEAGPAAGSVAPGGRPLRRGASWRLGFLTDISNPKAAAFFGSLFAALLPQAAPLWVRAAAVGIVVAIEFAWYCLVAHLFTLRPVAAFFRRARRWLDTLTGGLYLLLGVRLALNR